MERVSQNHIKLFAKITKIAIFVLRNFCSTVCFSFPSQIYGKVSPTFHAFIVLNIEFPFPIGCMKGILKINKYLSLFREIVRKHMNIQCTKNSLFIFLPHPPFRILPRKTSVVLKWWLYRGWSAIQSLESRENR